MTTEMALKCDEVINAGLERARQMIIDASEPVALITCAETISKLSAAIINLEQAKKL